MQLGPIKLKRMIPHKKKLKRMMSTTFKESGRQSGIVCPPDMNDKSRDVGNVLSERE
jgi:hypothetical protein